MPLPPRRINGHALLRGQNSTRTSKCSTRSSSSFGSCVRIVARGACAQRALFYHQLPTANHPCRNKAVHYDFLNRNLRYDINYLGGPQIPFFTLLNFSSYWLQDSLYMITYETPGDNTPVCIQLNLGFGMMKPNWFNIDSNQTGVIFNTKRSDSYMIGYWPSVMSVTDAGQGLDQPFSYYYAFNNNTNVSDPNYAMLAPWVMHAPSPAGMVLNEYYNFEPATFPANDPEFALPSEFVGKCVQTGFAATPQEAHEKLKTADKRLAQLPLAELFLGHANEQALKHGRPVHV